MWQEACDKGTTLHFKVISGSMSPLIEIDDVVKVNKVEPSEVRIGDIIAFQVGQNVMVHRIIGVNYSNKQLVFRHMGDAGAASGKITESKLIGRVLAIEKEGHEISLDTRWYIISKKIMGWRLQLLRYLGRIRYPYINRIIRLSLRPIWRLYRQLLLWRV